MSSNTLDKIAAYFLMSTADLVFFAASAFNLPPCSGCRTRHEVTKAAEKLGIIQAATLIAKSLFGELDPKDIARIEAALSDPLDN